MLFIYSKDSVPFLISKLQSMRLQESYAVVRAQRFVDRHRECQPSGKNS